MKYKIPILLVLLLFPKIACANSIIPVLVMVWPIQIFSLIPIVVLEGLLIAFAINITFKKSLWPTIKANLISTIAGVAIACVIMIVPPIAEGLGIRLIENFTDSSLPSDNKISELFMMIFFAPSSNKWEVSIKFVCFLVPFCFLSIFIEERVLRRCFPDIDRNKIRLAAVRSNIASYILLSILAIAFAYALSLSGPGPRMMNP